MSIVKDMSLAPSGRRKIGWVRDFMPALGGIEARFEKEKPFAGLRVAVSVHLEAKTANLGYVLSKGGAEVHLTGSNPLSTQDDVAAGLADLGWRPSASTASAPRSMSGCSSRPSNSSPT